MRAPLGPAVFACSALPSAGSHLLPLCRLLRLWTTSKLPDVLSTASRVRVTGWHGLPVIDACMSGSNVGKSAASTHRPLRISTATAVVILSS